MTPPNSMTPQWRKSTYSAGTGGECVEMATVSGGVLIRDSKDPDGPVLTLKLATMRDLVSRLQDERL